MDVRIVGVELPGRTCTDPRPGGLAYQNVHVGVQRRKDVVDLVPGDAPGAEWNLTVDTITKDGALDLRGPFVHGKRGDRFLYLSWGTVDDADQFEMFRRAKLMFGDVPTDMLRAAHDGARVLVCRLSLTDAKGGPLCARVRPPDIAWTVQ